MDGGRRYGLLSETRRRLQEAYDVKDVSGGELLVRELERHGIGTVFTLHGGHLDAIFQAALDHGIRLIDTRHEQAAGHAADGWARVTRTPGVAIVTAGPGVTDVVTAVTNAYLDCVPTLFIGGAAPLSDAEMLPLQGGFDQLDLLRPVTKWAHRITHTHRIPDLVAQALRVATTGRPGPVFLEIPVDVLFRRLPERAEEGPVRLPGTRPAPPPEAVAKALEWLRGAERPAILAGGGAWFAGAEALLNEFSDRAGIPVFANGKARGMVADASLHSGGSFGTLAGLAAAGYQPDAVLILGARLGLFTGGRTSMFIAASARVIQVDVEPEEIGRNREIDLGIGADAGETLRAMLAAMGERPWPDRSAWLGAVRTARVQARGLFASAVEATSGPIHPYRLTHEIARALPEDAIVVADGGETASWMDLALDARSGGSWLTHGYLGCLGVGLPFAIAAKVACPARPVLCVIGDGSVGLNFAEFDTMARHGLSIVTVVNNDQAWGMSKHGQQLMFGEGRTVVTELGPTRYDLAAAGFGCHGEFVEEIAGLAPALQRAFAAGRPACVNVLTDPEVIAPVTMAMVGRQPVEAGRMNLPYYGERED
jgi:acetolactate synthase-1/2/3 large subunit